MSFFGDDQLQQNWDKWLPKVFGYFYRRVSNPSDIEDLTAETMNSAFLAADVTHFDAYIWKVAHNHLVGYIRNKTKVLPPIPLGDVAAWQPDATDMEIEDAVSKKFLERKKILQECVDNNLKSEEDRKIVTMSIIEEKTSRQIGESLGIEPNTIRQKLSRTVRKLKKACLELWK